MRCDFCSIEGFEVIWLYRSNPFMFTPTGFSIFYDANWACCDVCSDLIEKKDLDELGRRCLEGYKKIAGNVVNPLSDQLHLLIGKKLHQVFMDNRIGPRELLPSEGSNS